MGRASCNSIRIAGLYLFLLIVLVPGRIVAEEAAFQTEEEETVYYDLSSDQYSYGEQVSLLMQKAQDTQSSINSVQGDAEGGNGKKGEEKTLIAVLCRTWGEKIDFDPWDPAYVVAGPSNCYTAFFYGEAAAVRACQALSKLKEIRYAELDEPVYAAGEETFSFHSWSAQAMNYGAYLEYSSQQQSGSILIAVVDSGICLHSFLADRILESGYDYIDSDHDATNDLYGHGTNVAGIIADCTVGAPVYLYPIRVLNGTGGGSTSNVINAVREATEKGVQIINLSLESSRLSEALDEAILDAVDAGITVVVAAGNKGVDTAQVSPAHLEELGVIVVGSAELDGSRSSYSNYGTSLDLYAYGTAIECCSRSGGFTTATGTSMSAAHISGASALVLLVHPEAAPGEVEHRLMLSTDQRAQINIPDLIGMIPVTMGFSLEWLRMDRDDRIRMPVYAFPETAAETIQYFSSDESVLVVEQGTLIPAASGSAVVTVRCKGFPECSFTTVIEENTGGTLEIPSKTVRLEDEAFFGANGFSHVVLPEEMESIGDHVFDQCAGLNTVKMPTAISSIGENGFSGAVLICPAGSSAEEFAIAQGLPYILTIE